MSDSVERFSNRVENYVRYRPDYPREIIAFLAANCGLTCESVVADIGCGTGISARMFLENGNRVIGIEPNAAMRAASLEYLSGFPAFESVDGTAAKTGLADASVDLVVAAQAFHWFDPVSTRKEFARILIQGGHVVLIWNERQVDTTPFLRAYEHLLLRYARDYSDVRHENVTAGRLSEVFGPGLKGVTFPNVQVFDFDGLKGRMLSSSYMPSETDAVYGQMIEELRSLFAKHSENDKIKVFYDTRVYYTKA